MELVNPSPNAWRFNPSLITVGATSIVSYRAYSYRGKAQGTPSLSNPTFEWHNGWCTTTQGYDHTVIGVLKDGEAAHPIILPIVDCRLLLISYTQTIAYFYAIGNVFRPSSQPLVLYLMSFHRRTQKFSILKDEGVICPTVQRSIEKNWSLVQSTHLSLLYSLAPLSTVDKECKKTDFQRPDFFSKLEDYYNTRYPDIAFHVSLSTPAIDIHLPNRKLSAGHIKWRYRPILSSTKHSPLRALTQHAISRPLTHPSLMYAMFLYDFDFSHSIPSDFRISPAFMDLGQVLNSSLNFPSGLTKHKKRYRLSYGVGDAACAYLEFTPKAITNLLQKPRLHPKNYDFGFISTQGIHIPKESPLPLDIVPSVDIESSTCRS